jgi:hypothetical protein
MVCLITTTYLFLILDLRKSLEGETGIMKICCFHILWKYSWRCLQTLILRQSLSFLSKPTCLDTGIQCVWQVTLRKRRVLPLLFSGLECGFNSEIGDSRKLQCDFCWNGCTFLTFQDSGSHWLLVFLEYSALSLHDALAASSEADGWEMGVLVFLRFWVMTQKFFYKVIKPAVSQLPGFLPIQFLL